MSTLSRAIAATACAATIGFHAQGQTQQSPEPRARATSAGSIIVIGCVSQQPAGSTARGRGATARLILTDTRSDPPAVYRLDGDQAALALHAGHTVEIAGALSTGPGTGRAAASARAIKVQSLTWISTSCPQLKTKGD